MKLAIIADIHGNLPGLEIVLGDIASRRVDGIVCLGDAIEGGEHANEVIELLRDLSVAAIRGNHDMIYDCPLSAENAEWLASLPGEIRRGDLLFTHISPRRKVYPISSSVEAWNVFDEVGFRLCFVGHLHFPALYGKVNAEPCDSHAYTVDQGTIALDPEDRYIISFGAIGYPRGGGCYLRYGIFDEDASSIEFIKLNGPLLPYGICA